MVAKQSTLWLLLGWLDARLENGARRVSWIIVAPGFVAPGYLVPSSAPCVCSRLKMVFMVCDGSGHYFIYRRHGYFGHRQVTSSNRMCSLCSESFVTTYEVFSQSLFPKRTKTSMPQWGQRQRNATSLQG